MRALSIRQPYAEAILRGVKTIEFRSRPTRVVGEPFYIYASKTKVRVPAAGKLPGNGIAWSNDLAMPGDNPPAWMLELAEMLILGKLPTGVIVGTAAISHVTGPLPPTPACPTPLYEWHLTRVERLEHHRKPARQPQPVWFHPF